MYLGSELDAEHPEVRAGTPLHGANLFPEVPGLRETLLEYLDATTRVGHRLMETSPSVWDWKPTTSPRAIPAIR